jgi:hypothetical protein
MKVYEELTDLSSQIVVWPKIDMRILLLLHFMHSMRLELTFAKYA